VSLIAKDQIPSSLSDVEAVLSKLTVVGVCATPPGELDEIAEALAEHLLNMGLDFDLYRTIKDGVVQVWANLSICSLEDSEDDLPRWDARIPVLLHQSPWVMEIAVQLHTDSGLHRRLACFLSWSTSSEATTHNRVMGPG